MNRDQVLETLKTNTPQVWDFIIIGGGASGLGTALEAASRGYKTLLLEQADFAKGTSSRSTKLVHGGVRYLAQGNIALVREALQERGLLFKNAPHVVKIQKFIVPSYTWWSGFYYTLGLKVYDWLSGSRSFGASSFISKSKTLTEIPNLKSKGLRGATVYYDGQFDDTRLAINIAQTVVEQGGFVINYMSVTQLLKSSQGKVCGVKALDLEQNQEYEIQGKAIINATGVFADVVLQLDKPESRKMIRPSQGVHIVLDKKFLAGDTALMIPKTSDGRVLFIIPWHDKVIVGTTDTPIRESSLEPIATESEIDFILKTAQDYLQIQPQKEDILSVFAGLRPLAAPQEDQQSTKEISRNHKILVSDSQLITITGGKWTTYRKMAQDAVDKAIRKLGLSPQKSVSKFLPLHGYILAQEDNKQSFQIYGSDQQAIDALKAEKPELSEVIHPKTDISLAEIVWSVHHEMARTIEDFLARRRRLLFLDAQTSLEAAPKVAECMAKELGKDKNWQKNQLDVYTQTVANYVLKHL
ncbi:MAG: glycerol-3-phosphate dehydrogenase/oxidase [Microscillaceae bacterium]|nr:glycerol-3-phosphate dehydrogenase/oxidase [Microscillaceae bacterium]